MFFIHVFNVFYKSEKTCFFYVLYLQVNVFNIYALFAAAVVYSVFSAQFYITKLQERRDSRGVYQNHISLS